MNIFLKRKTSDWFLLWLITTIVIRISFKISSIVFHPVYVKLLTKSLIFFLPMPITDDFIQHPNYYYYSRTRFIVLLPPLIYKIMPH
ncbi:uncharacterized protein OCT59_001346 [Rhizophagus irregularis]|uniref:uncharacterized protein n=1 Tax=Rhizophagus irregularis TaxID=588596 RepID=UPI000CAB1433|nr:hypothetical protein OCT59_001346 [Rhizophagus irregularis]